MKKYCYILICLCLFMNSATAAQDKLTEIKKPAYRLGITYNIEKEYKVTDITKRQSEKTASYEKSYIKNMTYADSTLKDISNEI